VIVLRGTSGCYIETKTFLDTEGVEEVKNICATFAGLLVYTNRNYQK
jgi:hypothetical protein